MMHDKLPDPSESIIISSLYATERTIQKKVQVAEYKTFGGDLIEQALSDGMIKLKEPNVYILTAKGAWTVETECLKYSIDDLLEKIDEKKFGTHGKNKKISDKNKVILLSLISLRAFSKETVASYRDNTALEAFWNALSESAAFLLDGKIISAKFTEMYNESGSKGKFGTLFGEIDKLAGPTCGIFVPGLSKYYLDFANEDGDLNKDKISRIFEVIFEEIPISLTESLINFCFHISRKYGVLLSDSEVSYCSSKWDNVIKRCIETVSGL